MNDYVTLSHNHSIQHEATPYGIELDVRTAMDVLRNMAYELGVKPLWETIQINWEVAWIDVMRFADIDSREMGRRSLSVSVEAEQERTDAGME